MSKSSSGTKVESSQSTPKLIKQENCTQTDYEHTKYDYYEEIPGSSSQTRISVHSQTIDNPAYSKLFQKIYKNLVLEDTLRDVMKFSDIEEEQKSDSEKSQEHRNSLEISPSSIKSEETEIKLEKSNEKDKYHRVSKTYYDFSECKYDRRSLQIESAAEKEQISMRLSQSMSSISTSRKISVSCQTDSIENLIEEDTKSQSSSSSESEEKKIKSEGNSINNSPDKNLSEKEETKSQSSKSPKISPIPSDSVINSPDHNEEKISQTSNTSSPKSNTSSSENSKLSSLKNLNNKFKSDSELEIDKLNDILEEELKNLNLNEHKFTDFKRNSSYDIERESFQEIQNRSKSFSNFDRADATSADYNAIIKDLLVQHYLINEPNENLEKENKVDDQGDNKNLMENPEIKINEGESRRVKKGVAGRNQRLKHCLKVKHLEPNKRPSNLSYVPSCPYNLQEYRILVPPPTRQGKKRLVMQNGPPFMEGGWMGNTAPCNYRTMHSSHFRREITPVVSLAAPPPLLRTKYGYPQPNDYTSSMQNHFQDPEKVYASQSKRKQTIKFV